MEAGTERDWAAEFDVSVQQIRDAVASVGEDKAKVEMYLKGSHTTSDSELTKASGS